jgi:hypothetical protein
MTEQLRSAHELVKRITARVGGDEPNPAADAVAVISAVERVSAELSRWVGTYGSRALLMRALSRAQTSHPVLSSVTIPTDSRPTLEGLPEAIESQGAGPVVAGLESMLVDIFELLSRLMGDALLQRLAEHSMVAGNTMGEQMEDEEGQNDE